MKLRLLPSMAKLTVHASRTALIVVENDLSIVPVWANVGLNIELVRFPPVVLPVVSIDTKSLLVLDMVDRTVTSLVVVHKEVGVEVVVMNQLS